MGRTPGVREIRAVAVRPPVVSSQLPHLARTLTVGYPTDARWYSIPNCPLPTAHCPLPTAHCPMKLIIAIIQPARLESVKAALSEVEVVRLTIMDVQGFGRQKGQTEVYRGHEISVNLLRKVQLQIAVNEDFVEPTINAIIKGGRSGETGEIGDGKIFVLPLDDCIRIRTGERGSEAI
jgi:nitrogen regulatory protein P-II 2